FARCVLRLTPQSSATQTVLESAVSVAPIPSRSTDRIGAFYEATRTVVIETPHRSLIIDAHSRVDVRTEPGRLDFAPAWEVVRSRGLETADLGPDGPASFIYP